LPGQYPILKRKFSKKQTRTDYARIIKFYDSWSAITERKALDEALRMANIQNGQKILEVAVGTGHFFERVVQINSKGENIGIDLSSKMLERACKKLKKHPLPSWELIMADACQLPFKNDQFDLLINNYMLDLLPEDLFIPIFREFRRVLKPGGILIITSMDFGSKWYHKFWFWIAKYFPRLMTNCRPINIVPYLREMGFNILETKKISQNSFPSKVIKAQT